MNILPKVYLNKIDRKICNEQTLYRNMNESKKTNNSKNINRKIDEIFADKSHVYKSKVKVVMKNEEVICDIIGKRKDYLLTLDNKNFKISDITDIEKI